MINPKKLWNVSWIYDTIVVAIYQNNAKEIFNMKNNMTLQDTFLNSARKDRVTMTFYLTNGFQFKGNVKSFDNFTILCECDGKQYLVYKHAVSTIVPAKPVDYSEYSNEG